MVTAPSRDLLAAARSFIRRSAGTAALVITPLAAVQFANTAHAQVIFQLPSGAADVNRSGSSFVTGSSPSGYFQSSLPVTANGRNGTLLGAGVSYTLAATSGGTSVRRGLDFSSTASVPFSGGGSFPVAYSFTFGTSGTITTFSWTLNLQTNGVDGLQTIASESAVSAGTFFGTGSYSVTNGATISSYTLELITSYNSGVGDTLTITMNQAAGQGIALNATAIPEPSTFAGLLGLAAGVLALFRRWRRPLTVG